uniref:Transmembrane protein n=1 Tax=Romanomermis culicivorax TaxID=13658 RepID=A0A915IB81_ROMCU
MDRSKTSCDAQGVAKEALYYCNNAVNNLVTIKINLRTKYSLSTCIIMFFYKIVFRIATFIYAAFQMKNSHEMDTKSSVILEPCRRKVEYIEIHIR